MAGHVDDLVIVQPALDHHVDLDRPDAGFCRCIDPGEHVGDREVDVADLLEGGVVECVEADGDPVQPGRCQLVRHPRQQHAVGGQRQLQRWVLGECANQLIDIPAQ